MTFPDLEDTQHHIDVAVIGGGQAALAVGFYLRRSGLSYVILDDQSGPGGSWRRAWESLTAFSPAQWSSLPGWLMPRTDAEYPTLADVLAYLSAYEDRYALDVNHGVHVDTVESTANGLRVTGTTGDARQLSWLARAVISATGGAPRIPESPGRGAYRGTQIHSSDYRAARDFTGKRVVVVGAGNSGAQIVADLTAPDSGVAHVTWATREPPHFLPDEIDGRYLFDQATARYRAQQEGRPVPPPRSLGDIVMIAPVRAARDRGDLVAVPMFDRLTEDGVVWPDGRKTTEDAIIWATGFRPALQHLVPLGVIDWKGRVNVEGAAGTRSSVEPRLWLVGYGNWTGYASATLIGVGRSARATVAEVTAALELK